MLERLRGPIARRARRAVLSRLLGDPQRSHPLAPPLPLPQGWSEDRLRTFVASVSIAGSDVEEYRSYRETDFRRFVYTWGLVREARGRALELGSAPYFTTALLRGFTTLDVTLSNFFSDDVPARASHQVTWTPPSAEPRSETFAYDHFNIERARFPYEDGAFDVVLFCEILEHLLVDPVAALIEVHRVLRPGGMLVLTTPNVARLENVARLFAGANIYDPYSGHGPYGRHNREYTMGEIEQLLTAMGFATNIAFSADVHPNDAYRYADPAELASVTRERAGLLGQYLFIRAARAEAATTKRPGWLYRNIASGS